MNTPQATLSRTSSRINWIDGAARRAMIRRLQGLRGGQITLDDSLGTVALGAGDDLHAAILVRDPHFYRQVFLGGGLTAAAAYFRGDWDCDDLTSLFRILVRNREAANRLDQSLLLVSELWHRVYHWRHANSKAGSRANIGAHYDLGNDFFRIWLDETFAYSSGFFPSSGSTLYEASVEKFDRICRRLDLGPKDHLLEIGTGWGGFAIHAATNYGCRVTTTTISRQQFDAARERIHAAGLSSQITLLATDYREISGRFDKLVSIEMIEAVGHRNFDTYFRKCSDLLAPDGSMLIQAIVMPDQWYEEYLRSVDFIQRYVFPGGCLPSMGAMVESAGRATDMRLVHCEDFGLHYAETLRHWRRSFHQGLHDVRRLGYSEEFIRLWDYYFCYCEAAFEERYTSVVQIQFDKPLCRRNSVDVQTHTVANPHALADSFRPHDRNSERSLLPKGMPS